MNKGQCITKYYRWIQKNGGYIWIQSSATIAINAKNASEKNIVWVNYVLRSGTSRLGTGKFRLLDCSKVLSPFPWSLTAKVFSQ